MVLEGKTALVTGAARGIGRAISEQLAANGADVAVADVREEQVREVAEAIEATGRRALALRVDVTRKEEVEGMVAKVVGAFGRIDLFFNNAGIIRIAPFLEATEEDWDRTMAVNAKGAFLCAQAVARRMVAAGRGKIVNTASIAARVGIPDSVAYGASKAAVMSLTRSMALGLAAKGVTVNAIAPGMIDTEMWDLIDEETAGQRGMERGEPRRRRAARIPLGRPGTAREVADVAMFLASDASDYMTGQTLNVDGGDVPS